jgi:N-carbamoyl-L-amino-acid hydrolase
MMAIRAEESSSWFTGQHGGHFGSRSALGLLEPSEYETAVHRETGRTLAQSIDSAGFDSKKLRNQGGFLGTKNVRGFIELHIEQGPVLVHERIPTGIVTSIRGTLRLRKARCIGAYSHSGAVPQHLRQDAVLATAEFLNTVERQITDVRTHGQDVVFACGRLHTDASADSLSKVPGETTFTMDIRSQDFSVLKRIDASLNDLAKEIGGRRNVRFDLGVATLSKPTAMNSDGQSQLLEVASALQIKSQQIASGAGHDAADFAKAGIHSNMIFVRNTGESHNPSEQMDMADFRDGCCLLSLFLANAAAA